MRYHWIFVGVILSFFFLTVYQHELVHQEIYRGYGINSTLGMDWKGAYTKPDAPCPTEECKLAHNINEAISYPLLPIALMFAFGMWFIIILLEQLLEVNYEKLILTERALKIQ